MQAFAGWILFTAAALWGQTVLGGIDLLGPGVALCLRLGWMRSALWLGTAWMMVQEGVGNIPFGAALLVFAGIPVFFFGLKWLLTPRNWVFTVQFSALMASWELVVLQLLLSLQGLPVALAGGWEHLAGQGIAFLVIITTGAMLLERSR